MKGKGHHCDFVCRNAILHRPNSFPEIFNGSSLSRTYIYTQEVTLQYGGERF